MNYMKRSIEVVASVVHFTRRGRLCLLLLLLGCTGPAEGETPVGTGLRFLAPDSSARDAWPCFSPDGKAVLFCRSLDREKSWHLFVVSSGGGTARRFDNVAQLLSETRPNWSPQTGKVAFVGRTADRGNCIWIANADGTGVRPLIGASRSASYPSWYPNGAWLAFTDTREFSIDRVDVAGGGVVPMTDRRQVMAGMCNVSPDGKWIAFAGQENNGKAYEQAKNSIWLVGDDGKPRALETARAQGRAPAWSPTGERLAFESNRAGLHKYYAVYVINRDGSGIVQVTPEELNGNHPIWSPDGTSLVFETHRKVGGYWQNGIAIIALPRS